MIKTAYSISLYDKVKISTFEDVNNLNDKTSKINYINKTIKEEEKCYTVRRNVWSYHRGNQNLHIEEEQTTQWWKEKGHKDKQRSTKHTCKTKDRVTRSPLKTGGELMCPRRISSACSTSDTRRVNLVTNPVISHEWGQDWETFTTSGTGPWSFVTDIQQRPTKSWWRP